MRAIGRKWIIKPARTRGHATQERVAAWLETLTPEQADRLAELLRDNASRAIAADYLTDLGGNRRWRSCLVTEPIHAP